MKIFWKKISMKFGLSARGASATTAETLLEAIIAISIFALILGPASALFVSSIRTVTANRNDLVAVGLAEEGIEIVRNFRDTNFIKFSPKATQCWNTKSDFAGLEDCENLENKIAAGNYILTFDPESLDWGLADGNSEDTMDAQYRLKQDIAPSGCDQGEGPACENYTSVYFSLPSDTSDRGTDSPFYRKINIEYPLGEMMKITSIVQYRAGSSVRSVQRVLILTNQPA